MENTNEVIKFTVITAEPLRSLLREHKMSNLQLAQKIGENVDVIRRLFDHPDTVEIGILRKICENLQCQPEDVIKAEHLEIIPSTTKNPG